MREALYILLLVAFSCASFALWSRTRYAKLAQRRRAAGSNFESFQADLRGKASDAVLRIVYDHFSNITRAAMPVLASDELGEIYGIVDDDIADELNELADKCGVNRPRAEEAYRVQTVADAVNIIESLRRRATSPEKN